MFFCVKFSNVRKIYNKCHSIAFLINITVLEQPNLSLRRLRYHLIVGRLRHKALAISGLVLPSAIIFRITVSFSVSVMLLVVSAILRQVFVFQCKIRESNLFVHYPLG